jgi:hypothetical protein
MRYEVQIGNLLGVTLETVIGGQPLTGLAATTTWQLYRQFDSKWWNAAGGTWDATPPVSQVMVELDATNLPGLYVGAVPLGAIDLEAGKNGYWFMAYESTNVIREYGRIVPGPAVGGVWKELVTNRFDAAAADFANLFVRMAALRQTNMRFVPSTWDAVTKQPTAGLVLIYETKADLLADVGPGWALAIGQYTVDATFSALGELTAYTSVQDS